MPKIGINLEDAKGFETIPEDTYPVRVFDVSEVKQGPNAQYVEVIFEVIDGEYEDRRLWRNYVIEGAGAGFIRDLIAKATGEELPYGESLDYDTDDLLGAKVDVVVDHTEYPEGSGDFRAEVNRILRAS